VWQGVGVMTSAFVDAERGFALPLLVSEEERAQREKSKHKEMKREGAAYLLHPQGSDSSITSTERIEKDTSIGRMN
jgi:hypothetical protein